MANKRFEVELPEEVLAGFGWQDAEVPHKSRTYEVRGRITDKANRLLGHF